MTCAARESSARLCADHVQLILKSIDAAFQFVQRHALARDVQYAVKIRHSPGQRD
jgi:hypothetical protein